MEVIAQTLLVRPHLDLADPWIVDEESTVL